MVMAPAAPAPDAPPLSVGRQCGQLVDHSAHQILPGELGAFAAEPPDEALLHKG